MLNRYNLSIEYKTKIGDFITTFSRIELGMSVIVALLGTIEEDKVKLSDRFHLPIKTKINKTDFYIGKYLKEYNTLYADWVKIKIEIEDLALSRNHLVHGTGSTDFFIETIKTMIDEKDRKLVFKEFSIETLENLINRANHVLTGKMGIMGFFYQEVKKGIIYRSKSSQ